MDNSPKFFNELIPHKTWIVGYYLIDEKFIFDYLVNDYNSQTFIIPVYNNNLYYYYCVNICYTSERKHFGKKSYIFECCSQLPKI